MLHHPDLPMLPIVSTCGHVSFEFCAGRYAVSSYELAFRLWSAHGRVYSWMAQTSLSTG